MSASWAAKMQNVFTAAKLLAIMFIIGIGFLELINGGTDVLGESFLFSGDSSPGQTKVITVKISLKSQNPTG